jgi:hypothetical protein
MFQTLETISEISLNKTKQNKTKQNKTKQNKTKQNKTKQKNEIIFCFFKKPNQFTNNHGKYFSNAKTKFIQL